MAECFSDGSRSGVLQQACVLLADSSEALVQKAISGEASAAEFFDVTWDSAARLFYSVVAEGDLYYKTHDREAVATPRQVKIALMQQGFETRRALQRVVNALPPGAELKGSIGEGPNHSNFSDRTSVIILSKLRNVL